MANASKTRKLNSCIARARPVSSSKPIVRATDFLGAAAKVANRDYRLVEMYTFVAVVYFVVSYSLSLLVKRLQDRIAIIR